MRLIFTACSGRTGTAYLASLLTLVPGLSVAHESPPAIAMATNPQCEQSLKGALVYMHSFTNSKAFALISHAFLKCRPEWWLEQHPETDVIVLTRPAREIALSSWKRCAIPDRTHLGRSTKLSPYADDLRYPIRNPEELPDYSLCYWHALEIEERQKEITELYKADGRTVHAISMKELVDCRGGYFHRLLAALQLPEMPYNLYQVIAKCKINGTSARSSMVSANLPNIYKFEDVVTERHIE